MRRGRNPDEWELVRAARNATSKKITSAKENYFASLDQKLSDSNQGKKTFWSILNRLINKKSAVNIPPLLDNGLFVTNIQRKVNMLNEYFVE